MRGGTVLTKILLIEDDKHIAWTLESVLKDQFHCDVKHASHVNEAVEQIIAYHPDIAIIDYFLADGTADRVIEMAHELKISKIIISSASVVSRYLDAKHCSRCRYLPKPFTLEQLFEIVA